MSHHPKFDVKDIVLANRFRIGQRIGGGSFGEIYRGVNLNGGEAVAIKIELASCKFPQLVFELKLYQSVNPKNDAIGIPSVYWYGCEGEYNCLVMDLLGPSLEDLHSFCGRKFSFKTTMILGAQMLNRLEHLHSQGFIHRDIKPDNFLMGAGPKAHIVYMIDFGLAKRYRDQRTFNHIPVKEGKSLTGTARYCSINTHCGIEQSRRDDLDAISYMLVYFLKGRLPWQELQAPNKQQRYDRIMEKKMAVSPEQLSSGIPQPEVLSFLRYCRSLGFSDTPDYVGWRRVFIEALKHEGCRFDYSYDWYRESTSSTNFVASPLVAMNKHHKRMLNTFSTGSRVSVNPLQTRTPLSPSPSQQTNPSNSVSAASLGNGTYGEDLNPTLGGEDGMSRGLDIDATGLEDSAPNYVAVVSPGTVLSMGSNVVHCRFAPHEPFVILRQHPKGYDVSDSSGSDSGVNERFDM